MRSEAAPVRSFRFSSAALWLALTALVGCATAEPGVLRRVVVPYPNATNLVQIDDAACQRLCPPASPPERLAGCNATSNDAVRRVMSDNVRNTHVVCSYAGEGER